VFSREVAAQKHVSHRLKLEEVAYVNPSFAEIARSVPSAMSPEWCGSVTLFSRGGDGGHDFVAAGTGTVELKTKRSETAGNSL